MAWLLPLLVLAAIGRGSLHIDVENQAMKSVGTPTADLAALEQAEFGRDPVLVLLATPRAHHLLNDDDLAELEAWTAQIEARPEVSSVDSAPSDQTGTRCLAVHVRGDEDGGYAAAVGSLEDFARESAPPTYRLAVTGYPALEIEIGRELATERGRILPLIVAALAVVLLLIYRSPVLAAGALAGPLLGVFLLEGFQGLLGLAIDPVSALLGPAVLTVGVASSVHVLERYLHVLGRGASGADASRMAAQQLRVPFLLALATTIAGFLGLLASPIPAVQHFGLLASLGTFLAVGITLVELPPLLRLVHRPAMGFGAAAKRSSLGHARWIARWAPAVTLASLALAVLAIVTLGDTHADNNPLHVLSADNSVRRESEEVARQLGGSEVFEVLLPPGRGAASPLVLAGVVARVAALDGVIGPASRPRRSEHGYTLLSFLMAPGGSSQHETVFASAESAAREAGWGDAAVSGLAVQIARDSNALVLAQRESILITTLGLWIVMSIGLRSWKLALLGLVPNLLPYVVIQGTLGLLGQPLSVASSMIGTVMLGLIVDDAIHLLHGWKGKRGSGVRRLARTLVEVRRPIVITTLVLSVGFATTLLGQLQPTHEFGGLALATLLLALLATLLLVPALLLLGGRMQPGARAQPSLARPATT